MAVIIIARYRNSPNKCSRKYFSYNLSRVIFVWQNTKKNSSCIDGNQYDKTNGLNQWYTQMKLRFYSNNCNIHIFWVMIGNHDYFSLGNGKVIINIKHWQTLIENINSLFVNGSHYAFIRVKAFSSWSFFCLPFNL